VLEIAHPRCPIPTPRRSLIERVPHREGKREEKEGGSRKMITLSIHLLN